LPFPEEERAMDQYYVYILVRPDNSTPFYVGMGQGDRAWQHVKFRKRGRSYKDNLICKMIDDLRYSEIPIVFVAKGLTHELACEQEIALIKSIGRHPHGPLTNVVRGGEGLADPTDEFRKKHGLLMRERLSSPEIRSRMSAKAKARDRTGDWEQKRKEAARSPEARTKQSLARKGKPSPKKGRPDDMPPEKRAKWREDMKSRPWYTDGVSEIRLKAGTTPPLGWQLGRLAFSPEHKAKMGVPKRGRPLSEEHKKKVGDAHRGQKRAHFDSSWWASEEGKAHTKKVWITDGQSETKVSPDAPTPDGWMRGRMIKGRPAHNKGKPMSEEAKRHLSEVNKGKTPSEETRQKISLAGKGRVLSAETRKKISLGHKARHLPLGVH
jgi:hypothetical protein